MTEEDAAEDWKHELDETVQRPPAKIKDWGVLRTQIKKDLKRKSKILMLSAINQLMILLNFATLRLKGASQIAASEDNGTKERENTLHEGCVHLHDITRTLNNFQLSDVVDTRMRGHF